MNIRRIKLLALASLCLPLCAIAQSEDHVSGWFSLGAEKDINKQLSVEVGGELRTPEQMRFSLNAGVNYKVNKYLKLGAGYTFIERRKGGTEDHYNKNGVMNGTDHIDYYLRPSHRATFDVTGTVKLWKWLRISARERYQYSYTSPTSTLDEVRTRYDVKYDGNHYYIDPTEQPEVTHKAKDGKPSFSDHVLRSRLKFELDKKKWDVTPFVFAEFHNSLSYKMTLEKIRFGAGAEYKFNKQHFLSLAYILTANIHDDNDGSFERVHDSMHVISVGYNYKF